MWSELSKGVNGMDGRRRSQKVSGKDFVEFKENVFSGDAENLCVID